MPCPSLTPPTSARAGMLPRRKSYQGPPTAIPYDPRHDRRISATTASVELWLAEHTATGWLAWHQDETIATAIGRSTRTVQHHLKRLKTVGRIETESCLRGLRRWVRIHGGRYGLTDADIPRSFPKSSRAIILRRRLTLAPGYTDDSIGSLPCLSVDDGPDAELAVHALAMDCDSESAVPEVHALAISCQVHSQSLAAPIVLEDCISQSKTSLRGDDERSVDLGSMDPEAELDPIRRKILEDIQRHPRERWYRRLLEVHDAEMANPSPKPVAAPVRPVAPPPPPVAIASASAPQNCSTGRLGGPRTDTAIRTIESVAAGQTSPEEGAAKLADLVADSKLITLNTYSRGLTALADGRATIHEALALVRDVSGPGAKEPNKLLSQGFADFARRVKKPVAGQPTTVPGDGLPRTITPIPTV